MLKDGLGNQMFEYAYAKKLQERMQDNKIVFCTFLYHLPNFSLGGTRRPTLQYFRLADDVTIARGPANFMFFLMFMIRMLFVYKKDFISWFIKGKRISRKSSYKSDCKKGLYISEGSFTVPDFVPSEKLIKYVFGNYEGVEAFPKNVSDLRSAFHLKDELNSCLQNLQKQMDSENSVCVHIRRGDYFKPGNEHLQVCDEEYYIRSIKYFTNNIDNCVFYIFSNTHEDIEWIKSNYHLPGNVKYVDMENTDYQELMLMRACKHFIISNSTFSWWASLLSDNENKIVLAPKQWTRQESNYSILREEFVCI